MTSQFDHVPARSSRRPLRLAIAASAIAVAPIVAMSGGRDTACGPLRPPALDRAAALIRTRDDLDAWLALPHGGGDPLAALSAEGRASFVSSLRFGPRGLSSFAAEPLQSELSATQAWRLLALFGLQSALAAMPPLPVRSGDDAAVEAWRRKVSPVEAP